MQPIIAPITPYVVGTAVADLAQGLPASLDELARLSRRTLQQNLGRAARSTPCPRQPQHGAEAHTRAVVELRARSIIDSAISVRSASHDPWLGQIRQGLSDDRFTIGLPQLSRLTGTTRRPCGQSSPKTVPDQIDRAGSGRLSTFRPRPGNN